LDPFLEDRFLLSCRTADKRDRVPADIESPSQKLGCADPDRDLALFGPADQVVYPAPFPGKERDSAEGSLADHPVYHTDERRCQWIPNLSLT